MPLSFHLGVTTSTQRQVLWQNAFFQQVASTLTIGPRTEFRITYCTCLRFRNPWDSLAEDDEYANFKVLCSEFLRALARLENVGSFFFKVPACTLLGMTCTSQGQLTWQEKKKKQLHWNPHLSKQICPKSNAVKLSVKSHVSRKVGSDVCMFQYIYLSYLHRYIYILMLKTGSYIT